MRQISDEGNAAAQAECVLRRHGGGKPEGKEGVSNSHVRGQDFIPKGRRRGWVSTKMRGWENAKSLD